MTRQMYGCPAIAQHTPSTQVVANQYTGEGMYKGGKLTCSGTASAGWEVKSSTMVMVTLGLRKDIHSVGPSSAASSSSGRLSAASPDSRFMPTLRLGRGPKLIIAACQTIVLDHDNRVTALPHFLCLLCCPGMQGLHWASASAQQSRLLQY